MRLVYLSLAWILGIHLGSRYDLHLSAILILIAAWVLFTILFIRRKALLLSALCLILLLGGILRFESVPDGDALQAYRGFFELRGVVAADPDVRDHSTTLRLEVEEIKVDGEWRGVSGTALVYAPKFPDLGGSRDFPYYRYGDLLEMEGVLESPKALEEFDFKEYLARQGVYSIVSYPRGIALIDTGEKPKPMEWIYRLRNDMSEALDEALPDPQCSLTKAMLLGQRGSISSEVREDFSRSGTSHLLAISGVHVSIIAGIVLSAGIWLFGRQRPTYFLLALSVIWLYALLTGMGPSAMRAVIMGSLWLYADWIGRPRSAFTALTFAAAIMLAIDPRLLSGVGFQLSFAAMAGLVFLTPIFQNRGKKIFGNQEGEVSSAANFLIGSFSVTLGAVLATLPLIAYYFELISMMSLPATFFTLPAIPGIIITAGFVGFADILSPAVADVLGWVTWLFATYVLETAELFADLPFSSVDVEVNAVMVWGYYGILVTALWLPMRWRRLIGHIGRMKTRLGEAPKLVAKVPTKWIAPPLAVVAVLVWVAALTASDDRLHIHIFDIGQGDSILISKENQQILIDGGPSAEKLSDEIGDKLPFWDRTIELMVLTHPDGDHIIGLVEVLRRYKVEKVLTSGQETDSDVYREWRKLIEEEGAERIVAQAGQQINMGKGIILAVLNPRDPPGEEATTDVNNNSVMLRLEHGNFSLLLTGDIGAEAEDVLLDSDVKLRSTVLKVPHHGSNTSTTEEFLAEVSPMFAVISVDAENKFGHPSDEVVTRLQKVVGEDRLFLTSANGTIEFITDGKRLWVDKQR